MVGMQMGVDRLDQLEVELLQQLAIAFRLLQHGIENQRLAAGPACKQIGVGAGNAVEQLAKDHGRLPPRCSQKSVTWKWLGHAAACHKASFLAKPYFVVNLLCSRAEM